MQYLLNADDNNSSFHPSPCVRVVSALLTSYSSFITALSATRLSPCLLLYLLNFLLFWKVLFGSSLHFLTFNTLVISVLPEETAYFSLSEKARYFFRFKVQGKALLIFLKQEKSSVSKIHLLRKFKLIRIPDLD